MARQASNRIGDRPLWRAIFIGTAIVLALLMIVAPILLIVVRAFSAGFEAYVANIMTPDTLHAIWLTVLVALIVVPVNTLFGVAAAWAVTKFEFPGRKLLITIIEIPFSISPVIAGAAYLFVYGTQGLLGPFLAAHDIKVLFAVPGIVLASMFVTAPFVARELIPLMQAQGTEEETVAASLGARGFTTFFKVTLPNIRWALLYGIVLCNARVMGEFGAVSVVSGNIRGQTNTLPLHIELLYHDYNAVGAFAAASVLTVIALFTLVAKTILEQKEEGLRSRRH